MVLSFGEGFVLLSSLTIDLLKAGTDSSKVERGVNTWKTEMNDGTRTREETA